MRKYVVTFWYGEELYREWEEYVEADNAVFALRAALSKHPGDTDREHLRITVEFADWFIGRFEVNDEG